MERAYICIDLKSYYASVECVHRRLDPLTTDLLVAEPSRSDQTICLAVSPSLKACGIPGRARLFEVIERLKKQTCAPNRIILINTEKKYMDELLRKKKVDTAQRSFEVRNVSAREFDHGATRNKGAAGSSADYILFIGLEDMRCR